MDHLDSQRMRLIPSAIGEKSALLLAALFTFPMFLFAAPLDPDFHHDGIQLAVAVAASEGLAIHRDVFSQYGPLTGQIQGGWLFLTEPTLYSLRILASIELSICVLMVTLIGMRLKLPPFGAALLAISWGWLCPAWALPNQPFTLLPWTSIDFLLLTLISAWLMLLEIASSKLCVPRILLAGVFMGMAFFSRPHIVAVFLLAWLVLGALTKGDLKSKGSVFFLYLVGVTSSCFVILIFLTLNGSFSAYVSDSLLGPAAAYPTMIVNKLQAYWLVGLLPLLLIYFPLMLQKNQFQRSVEIKAASIIRILALTTLVIASFAPAFVSDSYLGGTNSDRLKLLAGMIQQSILLFAGLVILLFLIDTVKKPHHEWTLLNSNIIEKASEPETVRGQFMKLGVYVLALASLIQMYPQWDAYHLWWASPLALVVTGFLLRNLQFKELKINRLFLVTVVIVGASGGFHQYHNLTAERTTWEISGILKGMKFEPEDYSVAVSIESFMKTYEDKVIDVECKDGIYSVWFGKYMNADSSFVSWAWQNRNTVENYDRVLFCEKEQDLGIENFKKKGYEVVQKSEELGFVWLLNQRK